MKQVFKHLSFVTPELRENNVIVKNINSGLDKSGKALKYQSRTAEILNYTFQLMSRSIGQMWKNLLAQLNPLTQIKKLFDDFTSYDAKFQRTMNVVKYNLRAIVKPMMQWIAQMLVNIIGFFDIILMKIQEAFGKIPISLFDQSAANAEKMREEVEEAANISAGFDELHDISGETKEEENNADNLMGDIYKPQLSEDWKKLAEEIGETFKGLITGDLGLGEVLARLLGLVGEALAKIGKMIWDWFKQTSLGKYLTENWEKILGTILAAFLGWKLLKIAGTALFNALFGKLLEKGAIAGIFSKIGSWLLSGISGIGSGILKFLGFDKAAAGFGTFITGFGGGLINGIRSVLSGTGGLFHTLQSMFLHPDIISGANQWGQFIGMAFSQALGVALGGAMVVKGFDMVADDASYNLGVESQDGKESDKRDDTGGKVLSTIGGAIAGGFITGGPIGAAIGAIAGLFIASLAPAIEEASVAMKGLNNEMQKIEYYEGAVQAATNKVNDLDEMLKMSNESLEAQKQKVYETAEEFGLEKDKVDALVKSVEDGSFSVEQLSGNYVYLADSLLQLDYHQQKNIETTKKLEEAKKKLMKAELELAIAEDVAAGNFEMAAARIEYAYATDIYTIDEATRKISQIIKEGSAEQANAILKDLSPDIKSNWDRYTATTDNGFREITRYYDSLKDAEKEAFLQDINPELKHKLDERNQLIKKKVDEANGFLRMLDIGNDGKILGISYIGHDIPGYATGTNYVPNDGLAYLHQGEAVIPKKYNQPYAPEMNANEQAYMERMMSTMKALDNTMKQGIKVNGQFTQRGSDLVAVVNRVNSQTGSNLISDMSYAR